MTRPRLTPCVARSVRRCGTSHLFRRVNCRRRRPPNLRVHLLPRRRPPWEPRGPGASRRLRGATCRTASSTRACQPDRCALASCDRVQRKSDERGRPCLQVSRRRELRINHAMGRGCARSVRCCGTSRLFRRVSRRRHRRPHHLHPRRRRLLDADPRLGASGRLCGAICRSASRTRPLRPVRFASCDRVQGKSDERGRPWRGVSAAASGGSITPWPRMCACLATAGRPIRDSNPCRRRERAVS